MDKAISKSNISVVSEKPAWSPLKDKGFFCQFFWRSLSCMYYFSKKIYCLPEVNDIAASPHSHTPGLVHCTWMLFLTMN